MQQRKPDPLLTPFMTPFTFTYDPLYTYPPTE